MIKKIIFSLISFFLIAVTITQPVLAQNSLLVNFGTNSCTGAGAPAFSLIKQPFSDAPTPLTTCSVASQVPDIFAVFIAYNPKNNKIYLADIRSGIDTKIWAIDMGLPAAIACPPALNSTPDYAYTYVSNNFEFDNNGDLWSFSHYNDTTGQCNMDKFDVNTGTVINTRPVQFPAGNFPTSISSGDFTILPNGRMFATLGSFPSRLYEITNYSSTTTNATAIFLDSLPKSCYGIAYLNGQIEITGSDFSGNCYYYKYNISTHILDSAQNFQNGQLPIDNTSITPSLGVTKQLLHAQKINNNTADLTYEIFVRNLGNVSLNNINVSDNLAAVYGVGNVSNINVTFVPGANAANLLLNLSYDGNTDSNLLIPGQNLVNQTSVNTDYFLKLRITFRVTNLNPAIYLNSAIGSATIGSAGTISFINVSDSSNNGPQSAADPNNNGDAGEPGENIPTPFSFATLPVKFISISAVLVDKSSAMLKWVIATPTVNSDKFVVEYSADGKNWNGIGELNIVSINQKTYQFLHLHIPAGTLYYRVKEIDTDGAYVYSNIALLRNKNIPRSFVISPNPANSYISIGTPANGAAKTQIILYDAVGKRLSSTIMTGASEEINTTSLPDGIYVIKIIDEGTITTQKVIVMHR
ncbi:MAG: T9SS type A sorting domain-containing protein [Ginsengibacter sp.]